MLNKPEVHSRKRNQHGDKNSSEKNTMTKWHNKFQNIIAMYGFKLCVKEYHLEFQMWNKNTAYVLK